MYRARLWFLSILLQGQADGTTNHLITFGTILWQTAQLVEEQHIMWQNMFTVQGEINDRHWPYLTLIRPGLQWRCHKEREVLVQV